MIRKLLPTNVRNDHSSYNTDGCDVPSDSPKTDFMEEGVTSPSKDGVPSSSGHNSEAMDVVNGFDKSSYDKGGDEDSRHKLEQPNISAEEEVWEEYGCILWDLAASRTHAELMVLELPSLCLLFTYFSYGSF